MCAHHTFVNKRRDGIKALGWDGDGFVLGVCAHNRGWAWCAHTFMWLLRSASERTVEALWSMCGELLDRFTEAECRNCFRHCGYRYT